MKKTINSAIKKKTGEAKHSVSEKESGKDTAPKKSSFFGSGSDNDDPSPDKEGAKPQNESSSTNESSTNKEGAKPPNGSSTNKKTKGTDDTKSKIKNKTSTTTTKTKTKPVTEDGDGDDVDEDAGASESTSVQMEKDDLRRRHRENKEPDEDEADQPDHGEDEGVNGDVVEDDDAVEKVMVGDDDDHGENDEVISLKVSPAKKGRKGKAKIEKNVEKKEKEKDKPARVNHKEKVRELTASLAGFQSQYKSQVQNSKERESNYKREIDQLRRDLDKERKDHTETRNQLYKLVGNQQQNTLALANTALTAVVVTSQNKPPPPQMKRCDDIINGLRGYVPPNVLMLTGPNSSASPSNQYSFYRDFLNSHGILNSRAAAQNGLDKLKRDKAEAERQIAILNIEIPQLKDQETIDEVKSKLKDVIKLLQSIDIEIEIITRELEEEQKRQSSMGSSTASQSKVRVEEV